MKKITSIILCVLMILTVFTEQAETQEVYGLSADPEIIAESAVLINYSTGEVLFSKDRDRKMYPASTTKILTGLLAIENLDMETVVTIDSETPNTDGSKILLSEGEKVTVEQLIYALLLYSANDAAVALAREVSGSVDEFAKLMNKRAKEIGAEDSNFVNANGLPDENHYTTANDLALIAREAMHNETFRKIVGTYEYLIPKTNMYDERPLKNTNRLLWDTTTKFEEGSDRTLKYEGANGIKTGYTNAAGNCLVAGAARDGTEFISVVLKGTPETYFQDSIRLLDYGFTNYYFKCLNAKGVKAGSIKVKKSRTNSVEVVTEEDVGQVVSVDDEDLLTTEVSIDKSIEAPFDAGAKAGTVKMFYDGELVKEYDLVTTAGAEKSSIGAFFSSFRETGPKILKTIIIIILAIAVLYIALIILVNMRSSKKRKARQRQRKRKR